MLKSWSSEEISGRVKQNKVLAAIGAESIYRRIFKERAGLINYLTRYGKEGKKYRRGMKRKDERK